jgi:PTH1 family peptidyl-tRNA hydrolase
VKLIVGLGNPGPRYHGTRHNVGFRVVDSLASRLRIPLEPSGFEGRFGRGRAHGIDLGLLQPHTFMNNSGSAVLAALDALPVEEVSSDLLIVYDDADLPLGRLRLRPRGGDGGHLGLRDVIACLGTHEVPRLRFGIGRSPDAPDTVTHVLQEFAGSESQLVEGALERACAAVESFLLEGIVATMDRFNAAPPIPVEDESG